MTDYITTAELASLLKIKQNTIERWRTNRECPIAWIKIGRRVLYDRVEVFAYLESQKRDHNTINLNKSTQREARTKEGI
ncbi:MAG: helix-turn-helix domain-containing protein [Rickettsiales bacterium]|jgi:excisionase family DNA binding protein|nr:helix-turn-helix domain-containing protein [Rickettsiales bacterium]